MSSWRPGDAPRGRRDYRDGPPPQRYDDRRGRSRSRERGPPPGRYEDRGPPGPGYGYQRGGPGYGYQGGRGPGYGRQGPPGYDGPPRGGYQGRDVYPRQRRPDQPIRKGRIGPRPSRECIALNRELTNPRTDVLQTMWKSTSASGAPDNPSLSHFSAMTWPSWLER